MRLSWHTVIAVLVVVLYVVLLVAYANTSGNGCFDKLNEISDCR